MRIELKILVVEDEVFIAEMIVEMLSEHGYKNVIRAKSYPEAINKLEKDNSINFAFLDINLEDEKSGVDLAHELNNTFNIPFVYLTSNTDSSTIQEAGVTLPLGYLSKPFKSHELFAAVKIGESKLSQIEKSIVIKDGHERKKIKPKEITFISSDNNYITINTIDSKITIRNSLDKFLEGVSLPKLVRVHRSYAVNIDRAQTVNGQYIIVEGEKIPMSRKYKDFVIAKFSC